MAFITNVDELQALLDGCSSTHDLELLLESILIPRWVDSNGVCPAVGTHRPRDTGKYSIPSLSSFLMTVNVLFVRWNNEYSLIFT